jgi:hypothetical protein
LDQLTPPPDAPKPTSRKAKMFEDLQKSANKSNPQSIAPPEPDPKPKPAPEPAAPEPEEPQPEPPADDTDDLADLKTSKEPDAKGKKPSPWKIAEEYKKKSAQLEKELAEARANSTAKKEYEALQKQFKEVSDRTAQMEEELRYVNYQKSDEFKKQYKEPYEAAWKRAMDELGQLTVDDAGTMRPINAQDLLQLVNLPLQKAKEAAKALFGDLADDVMSHRKEIKSLFDVQLSALEEAKKVGAEREKQKAMEMEARHKEMNEFVSKNWSQANEEVAQDERFGKFFSEDPKDQSGNERLRKGFALVDKVWGENPMDPRHSPEERQRIIRSHAMLRNRAAAFGRLVATNQNLEKQIAQLSEELESFKASEPARSGSQSGSEQPQGRGPWRQQVEAELKKRAR